MADTTETLLPCPFCGATEGVYLEQMSEHCGIARCSACNATHANNTEAEAIAAWNRRSDGWRPIESAPKDGTQVLLVDDAPTPEAVIGYWDENTDWRHVPGEWPLSPTHWQPLPAPPVRALEKAG